MDVRADYRKRRRICHVQRIRVAVCADCFVGFCSALSFSPGGLTNSTCRHPVSAGRDRLPISCQLERMTHRTSILGDFALRSARSCRCSTKLGFMLNFSSGKVVVDVGVFGHLPTGHLPVTSDSDLRKAAGREPGQPLHCRQDSCSESKSGHGVQWSFKIARLSASDRYRDRLVLPWARIRSRCSASHWRSGMGFGRGVLS